LNRQTWAVRPGKARETHRRNSSDHHARNIYFLSNLHGFKKSRSDFQVSDTDRCWYLLQSASRDSLSNLRQHSMVRNWLSWVLRIAHLGSVSRMSGPREQTAIRA
jgi:hypothetical protein